MNKTLRPLALILCLFGASRSDDVLIQTGQGEIRGVAQKARNGDKFVGFHGVPYGKPPVGDLR